MGNSLTSRIFIKSAIDPTNLKFGMVITWIDTIVQTKFGCHIATSPDEIDSSARITQRVYRYSTDQRKGKRLPRPTRRTPAVSILIARGS